MTTKMFSFCLSFALLLALSCVSKTSAEYCAPSYLDAQTWYTLYLQSPNYPYNYPSSTTCSWTITAPMGYVVELAFLAFNTEGWYQSSGSCSSSSDILEIYDGSYVSSIKLRGKYCSTYLPPKVYSSGRSLYLKFRSDSSGQRKGFKLQYKAVTPKPDLTICSPFNTFSQNNAIKYSGSSGYIKSPLYGSKYPSSMQCTWVITVPSDKKIKLTFSEFHVGESSYCSSYSNKDQLEIRDGKYSFSTFLKTVCGTFVPSSVYSTGRYMWIRFKSDDDNYFSSNTAGFRTKYEAVSKSSVSVAGLVVGVVIAVIVVISLVVVCVYIANRKRTPGHVNVPTPAVTLATRTTVSRTPYPVGAASPYPQQAQYPVGYQGSYQQPIQGSYQQPIQGSYQQPIQGSYQQPPPGSYQQLPPGSYKQPPPGSYPPSATGSGYPPQSSVPMVPYPSQPVPNDPPPAYPGPAPYPLAGPTAQQPATAANPNLPYPPPQGTEHQQSSPPYPQSQDQDIKQPTAPPSY